jgi:glycosyltransferase involved in cell wall biosynthesis
LGEDPLYSICITCRNVIKTISSSLGSILSQLDDRFEVILVDGGSTDGTAEIVRRIQRNQRNLIVIGQPCSRGAGRDIAYRQARGRYLIQQVDMDVIYEPTLHSILDYYHSRERIVGEYALQVPTAFLICSRNIMDRIGGWPDLQFAEDLYVYVKLTRVCTFERRRSLQDAAVKEHVKVRSKLLSRVSQRGYFVWRDLHRCLPFAEVVELLRTSLREEERSLPAKLGTVPAFMLGVLGQYSKMRYKLSTDEVQLYMWTSTFIAEWEGRPNFWDLIFDRTKSLLPRVEKVPPSHYATRT